MSRGKESEANAEDQGRKAGTKAGGAKIKAWLPRVTVVMVICVALLSVASYFQMKDIERGLLSVVADQQDGYVALVIGQINVRDNRDDQEIINDILGVLDESASRYWTFAKGSTMLFVKDVAETDKYKGLPSDTYFDDQQAEDFYDHLSTDKVEHQYVTLNGSEYIASGQAFEYQGEQYRLCLLTNESAVLDNNQLLGARSRLGALLGIEAALLLFSTVWLAAGRDSAARSDAGDRQQILSLNERLDKLDAHLQRERAYDADSRVWAPEALATFTESLARRGKTGWLARVRCGSAEDAGLMLARSRVLYGEEVARFASGAAGEAAGAADGAADRLDAATDDGREFCLLFLTSDEAEARQSLAAIQGDAGARIEWSAVGAADGGSRDER